MNKQVQALIISALLSVLFNIWAGGEAMKAETRKLDGTAWKLAQWTGESLLEQNEITLSFQKERLAGSGGCNRFTTGYEIDEKMLKPNPAIASTQMACAPAIMTQEGNFLKALGGVEQYAINSQGDLQLFYRTDKGLGIMTFSPAKDNQ
jgi:heat shock protein HslJ